jgi:hypothetical protein
LDATASPRIAPGLHGNMKYASLTREPFHVLIPNQYFGLGQRLAKVVLMIRVRVPIDGHTPSIGPPSGYKFRIQAPVARPF